MVTKHKKQKKVSKNGQMPMHKETQLMMDAVMNEMNKKDSKFITATLRDERKLPSECITRYGIIR